jgi:hypothetical protein
MMARGWLAMNTPAADWSFSIDLTVAGNLDIYTSSGADLNVVEAMNSLVAWCNGLTRPWFGNTVFSWQHTNYGGRGAPKLASSGLDFDYDPDAQAQTALGIAPELGTFITDNSTGAIGAWYPAAGVSLTQWLRTLGDGDAGGNGAVRSGVPGLGRFAPPVEAWATAAEMAVLPEVLRAATLPRRGQIYDAANDEWRQVSVGGYTQERSPVDAGYYMARLTARGEVL